MYKNIIIIPYRNREAHLDIFIRDAIPLFEKYLEKPYKIIIVEQEQGKLFNRGKLLNIGFNEYRNKSQYYFTHDIDIIPTEKCITELYNFECNNSMIGIYTSQWNTMGGIIKFDGKSFIEVNGFPNNYWGWGVEDKALQNRVETMNINITKFIKDNSVNVSEYFTVRNDIIDKHQDSDFEFRTNFEYGRYNTLSKQHKLDYISSSGLNNLEYKIVSRNYINNNNNINIEIEIEIEIIKVDI